MKELNKAIFVDLDGTLITTESGRRFPLHSKDWKLIPETLEGIKYFYKKGFKIIIVTNQGGIEEGYLNESIFIKKIEVICNKIEKLLKIKKNSIIYYYCKEMDSYNRKPNPGMAYEAGIDYDLALNKSVMFGNYITDAEFAIATNMEYYDILEIKSIHWENK